MEEGKSSDSPLVSEGDTQAHTHPSNSEEVRHPQEGHLRDHDYVTHSPNDIRDPSPNDIRDSNSTNTLAAYSPERDSGNMAPGCPATAIDQEQHEETLIAKFRFPRVNRVLMCPVEDRDVLEVVSVSVSNPELGEDPEGAEALWDHFWTGLGKPDSYYFTSHPNGLGDWSSTKMSEHLRTKLEEVRDSLERVNLDPTPVPERPRDSVEEIHVRAEEGGEPELRTSERLESQPHPNQATPTPQGGISSDKVEETHKETPKSAEPEGGTGN